MDTIGFIGLGIMVASMSTCVIGNLPRTADALQRV